MSEWQPIETAPKDKAILAYNPVVGVFQTYQIESSDGNPVYIMGLWGKSAGRWYPEPTHWMPIPEPPK